MDMIKVAVIGTIGSLLALALKSAKGEFATYINLSACVSRGRSAGNSTVV